MYKVVRMERFVNTVSRDDFKFDTRQEAEDFFVKECEKPEVVDISLFCCFPYRDDVELTRFVRHGQDGRELQPVVRRVI